MARPATSDASELAAWVASLCDQRKETRTGWHACCPAHDDTHPSLSIDYANDRVLLVCRSAGCTFEAICAALMLKPAELFCGPMQRSRESNTVAAYEYEDEHGTVLFQVRRTSAKQFFQYRPDPSAPDGWAPKIPGVRRVLYHLPEVCQAIARAQPIYITEGEKDADNLRAIGLTATCNPMGASTPRSKKWLPAYSEMLRGADCYLLPDHDSDGAAHMQNVAGQLHGIAAFVRIVPGIHTDADKSDVSDWLAAGGTREELETRARQAPLWHRPRSAGTMTVTGPPGVNGREAGPGPSSSFDPDTMYTDTYNARAFAKDHKANVRYCSAWKTWIVWNGKYWERDSDGTVMQWAKKTVKNLAKLLHGMDTDQSKALLSHIARSLSTAKLEAMLKSSRSEPGIPIKPDAFDRDIWLLNCTNGTIDLRTGTLRAAARDDYLTRCLSIAYNSAATCPRWEGFLERVMGSKQGLVEFLHRAIGYSLTGSTMEQCLFILHGPTKTGKSTFLSRLRALLGPYGTQADMESFMHKERQEIRNDLADLAGARVVCAIESQEGRRLNENLIKQLTGGVDQVKARFLFEDYFTFTPQFKVFLGSNHKPVIKDNDQAIWERIRLVPFVVQIPPEDRRKTFDAELHAEIEGILAWAVRGCLAWQKDKGLKEPEEVINATKEYQEESDVIGRFITEKCEVDIRANTLLKERATPLFDAYKAWCESNGEWWENAKKFSAKLVEDGCEKTTNNGVIYKGIQLKKAPEDDDKIDEKDPVPF